MENRVGEDPALQNEYHRLMCTSDAATRQEVQE